METPSSKKPPFEDEPQPRRRELPSHLPTLEVLAWMCGIESDHPELKKIEAQILDENMTDETRLKALIDEYDKVAGKIIEENNGNSKDSLALILQLAYFRYKKGMYRELLEVSFINMNEALKSPEINDETYELVGNVMTAIRAELSETTDLDTSIKKTV